MSKNSTSSRRMFLKGGALLAAPMAAGTAGAMALAGEPLRSGSTHHDDEAAIRQLHQSWLWQVNAGELPSQLPGNVHRIGAAPAGTAGTITIAADGRHAVGHFEHLVELQTPLSPDSTLAQMAHIQGNGKVRHTQLQRISVDYDRSGSVWRIVKIDFEPVSPR